METSSILTLAVIAALLLYTIAMFNRLVALKNRFKNAFAQIEVQLKRRHDLIPNLVETARAYLRHERDTLEAVVEARNAAAQDLALARGRPGEPEAMDRLGRSEQGLAGALGRLNVAVEAYPELRASQNMMQLSEELASTENRVAFARQAFNDQVMAYNTYRQSFPQNLLAGLFGHGRDAALLEFEDRAQLQAAPRVSF